jgi:hypothetical protein
VSKPSDVDSKRLALAHRQARDAMKRCDELIQRAERELSKFGLRSRTHRNRITAVGGHIAGRFSFVSLNEPPGLCPPASNNN